MSDHPHHALHARSDHPEASTRTTRSVTAIALASLILGVTIAAMPMRGAQAQTAATAIDTSADALLAAADRVLALLDAGNPAPLWQEMPPALQSRFTQDAFAADMTTARRSVGALKQRTWVGIGRLRYPMPATPQGVPAGLYANVDMSSAATDGRTFIERVSFRIEDDGRLRFTGYVPRALAAADTAPGTTR